MKVHKKKEIRILHFSNLKFNAILEIVLSNIPLIDSNIPLYDGFMHTFFLIFFAQISATFLASVHQSGHEIRFPNKYIQSVMNAKYLLILLSNNGL